MCSRPSHFLFACLLTIIASGDDFNLVRVLVSGAAPVSPTDGLPLDDPNTDFTDLREGDACSEPDVVPDLAPIPHSLAWPGRPDAYRARCCAPPMAGLIAHAPTPTPLRC